jgi:hypothetical protein
VTVWLRDGSELRGKWKEPELAMEIQVGGGPVAVDLPTSRLERFQTQDGEVWPDRAVMRVRTSFGDDFLVDAEATRLSIVNELGTFSPFLSECLGAAPLGDPEGEWRIELHTGTVLIGPLADEAVVLIPAMGPREVVVPAEHLLALERQAWNPGYYAAPAEEMGDSMMPQAAPAPTRSSPEGWFDNYRLRQSKQVVK